MWQKLSVGLGAVLVLLVVISALSLWGLRNIDGEVTALNTDFLPLQQDTAALQAHMISLPGSMNAFLYTRDESYWKTTEAGLGTTREAIRAMTALVKAPNEIPDNGNADKVMLHFDALEKAIRDSYATHQEQALAQQRMAALGARAAKLMQELYVTEREQLQRAMDMGLPEAGRLLSVTGRITRGMTLAQEIRARMLRSLAEQNRSYCQDNMDVLFPQLLGIGKALSTEVSTDRSREQIAEIDGVLEEWRDSMAQVMALWDQMDALLRTRDQARVAALDLSAQIAATSQTWQKESVEAIVGTVDSSTAQTVTFSVVAVLAGLGLALFLTRAVTGPLSQTVGFARAVADGELNRRLRMRQKDEIGQLAGALDIMVDSLNTKIAEAEEQSRQARAKEAEAAGAEASAKSRTMLVAADRLQEVAGIVSSASTQLSAQIEQSGHGATEQAARMTETATAMEEMNATVLEVAQNAGSASDASAATRRKAEDGAAVVQQAVISIRKVRDDSLILKQDMAALSEHAQSISRIMAVISDIADQTNLLALNAAIEAARAGDAGRGFAVVADEVRNLAEKTMASTTDVGDAIKAIQDSAAKSMEQVDTAVAGIEEATDLANRSGEALSEIVGMVDRTADQVRAIAAASEEQSAASDAIHQSISQVNGIASETAQAMSQASTAVAELAAQARHLTGLIEEMKNS